MKSMVFLFCGKEVYIEAGAYLEKIFPFIGIRFISITDGYDSAVSGDAEKALMVPLKNMINTAYAKDISRKSLPLSDQGRQREKYYRHLLHTDM